MSNPERYDVELGDLDGRRLRRERNRLAVVDAMLSLIAEGNLSPNTAEIAERAGSSARSLFRYFDDVGDLQLQAVERHLQRVGSLLDVAWSPDTPLGARIDALVTARLDFVEAAGNVAVVARMRAPVVPVIREVLTEMRRRVRDQIEHVFAAELAAMPPGAGSAVHAAVDVLVSYESVVHLRDGHGLDREAVHIALVTAIAMLFASSGATG